MIHAYGIAFEPIESSCASLPQPGLPADPSQSCGKDKENDLQAAFMGPFDQVF